MATGQAARELKRQGQANADAAPATNQLLGALVSEVQVTNKLLWVALTDEQRAEFQALMERQ